ncbi:MCE family protein [Umezawaea beigongshangensis]|uniref:MCE family protein n=1 Tax=Umezawaea beigongshangensis TaxID=2780383 RepID=UPI0018F11E97|nr:MlaD family protein [Umezawaea beigongshangensis]
MLSGASRARIAAFVVVALLGVSYTGARYAGLDRFFDGGDLVVRLELADAGGVFSNAEVTYRGVAVGRVGPLRLDGPRGVTADLVIDADAPPIPADVLAVVANRSAVGEQYVDLRPRSADGPVLVDGSVVRREDTRLPLPVDQVLTHLDGFASSVPTDSLAVVVDELDEALRGRGADLGLLLDTTSAFTRQAREHLPQTTRLITDAGPVLRTQLDHAAALRSFAADAELVAARLRDADADVRSIIETAPRAAGEVGALLRESGPALGTLLANLVTTADVLVTRRGQVEQILVTAPDAVTAGSAAFGADGANFGLSLTFFDPPPCTAGYGGTPLRGGLDVGPGQPLNEAAGCTAPAP